VLVHHHVQPFVGDRHHPGTLASGWWVIIYIGTDAMARLVPLLKGQWTSHCGKRDGRFVLVLVSLSRSQWDFALSLHHSPNYLEKKISIRFVPKSKHTVGGCIILRVDELPEGKKILDRREERGDTDPERLWVHADNKDSANCRTEGVGAIGILTVLQLSTSVVPSSLDSTKTT
jgi:hypothetical protein